MLTGVGPTGSLWGFCGAAFLIWVVRHRSANHCSATPSQRAEKREQIGFLLSCLPEVEPSVELDRFLERGGRPVVEVWRPRGQATQDRALELADVLPFAADHRAARIRGHDGFLGGDVSQRVDRQVRSDRGIGQAMKGLRSRGPVLFQAGLGESRIAHGHCGDFTAIVWRLTAGYWKLEAD